MGIGLLAGAAMLLAFGCSAGALEVDSSTFQEDAEEFGTVQNVDLCESLVCVTALPAALGSQSSGPTPRGFDVYGCIQNETFVGEETIYKITLQNEGFLSAGLSDHSADESVIVLLDSLDSQDCIDSHSRAVGALLPAGEYFIVVDSLGSAEQDFSLQVAQTTVATLEATGINSQLASDALVVFGNAWTWGATRRTEYTIVDFSMHSAAKRQWTFDLSTNELLWNLRVAHGRYSSAAGDPAMAVSFSNESGSNQSSLGLQRAAGTYTGSFGDSFRMEGLEPGYNDNVCSRAIVMHPWAPISDGYIDRCGFARPTWGCPAIDSALSQPVRNRLARPDGMGMEYGSLMFYWHPSSDWYTGSVYLRGSQPTSDLLDRQAAECDSSTNSTPTIYAESDYSCQ